MWSPFSNHSPDLEPVIIRRSPRAKRMLLRVDARSGAVILTLPPRVPEAEGLAFVERQRAWIARTRSALAPVGGFGIGDSVPILGQSHQILHDPASPRQPQRDDAARTLTVGGEATEVANRVRRYLRAEAQDLLLQKTRDTAARLGRSFSRIRIGDPRSRWGSCTSSGTISYSWRLVMAPDWVVDYVVAHEVAHLAEMNHSPRFWKLVDELVPHRARARAWLRKNGAALQRMGN